jgi:hypothetical protein
MSQAIVVDHGSSIVQSAPVGSSELSSQLDAAHKYPRDVKTFLNEAKTIATLTREIAESCIYSMPRDGKSIAGPSVRLAEICASAYGNLRVETRVVEDTGKEIVARGTAWDTEKNLAVSIETRRRIVGKNGKRYSDDMITVTGNAAASIALRNALFRVIPKAYVDLVYEAAREVSVGNAKTLDSKRAEVVGRLQKMGVPVERIFARVDVAGIESIGLDELETLIGYGTAIKQGEQTIDEAFPAPDAVAAGVAKLEARIAAVKHDADGVVDP